MCFLWRDQGRLMEEVVNGKMKANSPSYPSISQDLVKWPRCGEKRGEGEGVGHRAGRKAPSS